jgi:hypothetical protein
VEIHFFKAAISASNPAYYSVNYSIMDSNLAFSSVNSAIAAYSAPAAASNSASNFSLYEANISLSLLSKASSTFLDES